jgi:hypothetical protein
VEVSFADRVRSRLTIGTPHSGGWRLSIVAGRDAVDIVLLSPFITGKRAWPLIVVFGAEPQTPFGSSIGIISMPRRQLDIVGVDMGIFDVG